MAFSYVCSFNDCENGSSEEEIVIESILCTHI